MSPWHYLGSGYAERRYVRRHRREPKHRLGVTLFPVHIGPVLRALRARPDVQLVDARPRYYPRWCRLLVRLPGLREVATWNLLLIMRRVGCQAGQSRPGRAGQFRPAGRPPADCAPAGDGRPARGRCAGALGVLVCGPLIVLLANDPGRMFFDTKLSVDLDPSGFYARPVAPVESAEPASARCTTSTIGYAVPMAPFYLAGHLAHVPVALIERLWLSLIIAVGFGGLVKLAGALGIGSPASRGLAGLVFALWPTFTIVIGSTSSAALPGMLAPWAVLPLVTAVRGPGRVVWAAARSGAVVLCMCGVNATVTIDALLLPGLFILTYARGRRLAALALCWAGAVVMATAWWVVPLLLQGRYAFNFLPYIEQAPATTGTMSAAAACAARELDGLPQPRHARGCRPAGPW